VSQAEADDDDDDDERMDGQTRANEGELLARQFWR